MLKIWLKLQNWQSTQIGEISLSVYCSCFVMPHYNALKFIYSNTLTTDIWCMSFVLVHELCLTTAKLPHCWWSWTALDLLYCHTTTWGDYKNLIIVVTSEIHCENSNQLNLFRIKVLWVWQNNICPMLLFMGKNDPYLKDSLNNWAQCKNDKAFFCTATLNRNNRTD